MPISRRQIITALPAALAAERVRPARAQASRKTITWWYGRASSENQAALEKAIVAPFNASQSDYELRIEVKGTEVDRLVRVAMLAGNGPDIIPTLGSTAVAMSSAGQLLPLDEYARKYDWSSRFLPGLLETGMVGGKLYAMPRTFASMSLFYNKKLFSQNGWSVPRTRAEMETLATAMLAKGIVPISNGNADWKGTIEWISTIFLNHGAGPDAVYKALRGEIPWTSKPFVDAMELCRTWYQKGYFDKNYFSITGEQAFLQVVEGRAGMSMNGTWAFQYAKYGLSSPNTPIDFAAIPPLAEGIAAPVFIMSTGEDLSINKTSQVPDGAAAVLDFLLKRSTIKAINADFAGKWNLPIKDLSISDLAEVADPMFVRNVAELKGVFEKGAYGYADWDFFPPATRQALIDGHEQLWLNRITAHDYMAKIEETFSRELKQNKVPPLPARNVIL